MDIAQEPLYRQIEELLVVKSSFDSQRDFVWMGTESPSPSGRDWRRRVVCAFRHILLTVAEDGATTLARPVENLALTPIWGYARFIELPPHFA
jgi:hypothetical protein